MMVVEPAVNSGVEDDFPRRVLSGLRPKFGGKLDD